MAQRFSSDLLSDADEEKNSIKNEFQRYDRTSDQLNTLRRDEFNRLKGVAYLDHAGTTLYGETQLKRTFDDLRDNLYGNPHSRNSSGKLSTDLVDYVRARVVEFFNTTLEEYNVIFTSGATGASKLLAEVFDWSSSSSFSSSGQGGGHFVYLEDNHTSVIGMRELAFQFGSSSIYCLPVDDAFQLFHDSNSNYKVDYDEISVVSPMRNSLFAFPAQSNFCGRKYPLSWIWKVQRGELQRKIPFQRDNVVDNGEMRWSVLLDVASFVGTSYLNLQQWKPDFVSISFHKMFGFPTGLGALLVRQSASNLLLGSYFGGGTVLASSALQRYHVFQPTLPERFETGTVSFLDVLAVRHGLDFLQSVVGFGDCGMLSISKETFHLARYVHHRLTSCRHGNGTKVVLVYCGTDYEDVATQGAIVNFNLLRSDGHYVGFAEVEKMAAVYDIHFRTGCMCNPGACQRYLKLTLDDLKHHLQAGHVCGDNVDLIDGRPTGSIRVSFGYMSTWDDADRLVRMIELCFVDRRSAAAAAADSTTISSSSSSSSCSSSSTTVATITSTVFLADVSGHDDVSGHLIQWSSGGDVSNKSSFIKEPLAPFEKKPLKYEIGHKLTAARRAWWTRNPSSCYKINDGTCRCSIYGRKTCSLNHVKSISLFPVKSCGAFQKSGRTQVGSASFYDYRQLLHWFVVWFDVEKGGACDVRLHTDYEQILITGHLSLGRFDNGTRLLGILCRKNVGVWRVGPRGFLYDREWLIVTNGGVSLTQKREPKMCLIKPEIDLEHGYLWLRYNETSVKIPLDDDDVEIGADRTNTMTANSNNVRDIKVCGDRIKGIDCGGEVADWLSLVLGRDGCRLLRQPPDSIRTLKTQKGGTISATPKTELSLVNQAQYLLLNVSSACFIANKVVERTTTTNTTTTTDDGCCIDGLSKDKDDKCGVDKFLARFRGNLVVDGPLSPFSEEEWKCVLIGETQYNVQGPCNRCQMICIDQETGERTKEPLVTLTSMKERKTNFGIYLYRNYDSDNEVNDDVVISVGDPVVTVIN